MKKGHWTTRCILIFSVILLFGTVRAEPTRADPVEKLVKQLNSTHGFWINGFWVPISLPETASIEQLVLQYMERREASYTILKSEKVKIDNRQYTAVLLDTHPIQKILVMGFNKKNGWGVREYKLSGDSH